MPSDGPFGAAPDIGVGFSDAALLLVSVAGFCFLSVTVYSIVLTRLQSRRELEKNDEADAPHQQRYEEQLAQANVATLSRAQRRARARTIMKQQRRIAPLPPQQGEQAAANEGQALVVAGEAAAANDAAANEAPALSRKERQRLAKAVEREERKILGEERREQQLESQKQAQEAKRERLRREAERREESKQLAQQAQEAATVAQQKAWVLFLECEDQSLSVDEWLGRLSSQRVVPLQDLADGYGVTSGRVEERIRELIRQHRVAGVFSEGRFIAIFDAELQKMARMVQDQGMVSAQEVADWMNQEIPITS